MTEEAFSSLIDKHVRPMFTGADLAKGPKPQKTSRRYATLRTNQLILARWPELNTRRVALKRSQHFDQSDAGLVHNIISNLVTASRLYGRPLFDDLIEPSIRRAISKQVAPPFAGVVARLISQFEQWSQQTYEGRPISAAIGINPHGRSASKVMLFSQLESSYGIVVANGLESFLTVSSEGHLLKRISLTPGRTSSAVKAPIRFVSLAKWAKNDRIAIALTRNGEILVFKSGALIFAKRRGAWRHFPHKSIISRAGLKNKFPRALIEAMLELIAIVVTTV